MRHHEPILAGMARASKGSRGVEREVPKPHSGGNPSVSDAGEVLQIGREGKRDRIGMAADPAGRTRFSLRFPGSY